MTKTVMVNVRGKFSMEIMYSDVVEVEVTDNMTEDDIIEEARNKSQAGNEIVASIRTLEDTNNDIELLKIEDAEPEEFDIEGDDEDEEDEDE